MLLRIPTARARPLKRDDLVIRAVDNQGRNHHFGAERVEDYRLPKDKAEHDALSAGDIGLRCC